MKKNAEVETKPSKLYCLSLNAQTHNSILLQGSTFLLSRCAGKAFVCGEACQPAGIPDVICPALHTWEVLVGYTLT